MTEIAAPTDARLRQALHGVLDPEIGESIVDLGLVERIDIAPQRVHVVLIPTSATCPMSDLLIEDAAAALRRACPPGTEVGVALDWGTPWEPRRMSSELQSRFGW